MPGLFCHPHTRKRVYEQTYALAFLSHIIFSCSRSVFYIYIYSLIYSLEMRVRAIVHVFPTFLFFKFLFIRSIRYIWFRVPRSKPPFQLSHNPLKPLPQPTETCTLEVGMFLLEEFYCWVASKSLKNDFWISNHVFVCILSWRCLQMPNTPEMVYYQRNIV